METKTRPEPVLTAADETKLQGWIESGETLTAWEWMTAQGDPLTWKSRIGRTMVGRLLDIRGASRQSDLWQWRCWQAYQDDPVAVFYAGFRMERRFGPERALRMVRGMIERSDEAEENPDFSGLWVLLSGLYAEYQDFDRARESQALAEKLAPTDCWILLRRSSLLLSEDKPEEALEVAEAALRMCPNYRAAIGSVADQYWSANRDEEAFSLIRRGIEMNDGPDLAAQLAGWYDETGEYEKGLAAIDIYEERSPMADKSVKKYIASMRAMFHFMRGNGASLVEFAETSDQDFYKDMAKRVEEGVFQKGTRKILDVGFVRQNEITCAPATLTALAKFWGREADHLEIAEEICYDGTPEYKERRWAEKQGWFVREFTADLETNVKLIDAGVPYTLVTTEATSAHLQAMIGYDTRGGTIVIRDPSSRHFNESTAKAFFENYAFSGPRAMLFLPVEEKHRLDGIELRDTNLFDLYFEFQKALEKHDREGAQVFRDQLKADAPKHLLTEKTEWSLSSYDGDFPQILEVVKRLTKAHPKALKYRLDLFRRNQEFQTREERIEWLREELKRDDVLTLFYKELADLLADDARRLDDAMYYYRRAMKFRQTDPETLYGLAGVLWEQREFQKSEELYLFSSCLNLRDERFAESYFKACRCNGEPEKGLCWLRKRYELFGKKSSGPAITLFNSLEAMHRDEEKFALLDEVLEKLPEDGELLMFAAEKFGVSRKTGRVRVLLDQARGKASERDFLRLKAKQADLESDPKTALETWELILENEPFAMDAYRAMARLRAELEGPGAAVESLAERCDLYPNYAPLQELRIAWLRDLGPGAAEEALRDLITRHPNNSWAIRELSVDLSDRGDFEAALEMAKRGVEVAPNQSTSHGILGSVFEEMRDFKEARGAFKKAILLDVENDFSLRSLIRVCQTDGEKREALVFVEKQLVEQVLFGDGLTTFREVAFRVLEPEELLESLKRANEERPDLWQTWSTLVDQQLAMQRPVDAMVTARELTERFPMKPRGWLDLAQVHQDTGQVDKEIEALEKALELNPQWDSAMRQLADAFEKKGEADRAVEILRRAVNVSPLVPMNHGCLADTLWKVGEQTEAFDALKRSVEVDPDYTWAWNTLGEWANFLGREDEAIEAGRKLASDRPADPESWLRLARIFANLERNDDRLEALREGIEHCPLATNLHDIHALALAQRGRYAEAIEACDPDCYEGERPYSLAGREAWVEHERGNGKRAIEILEKAREGHSDWTWACECLSDWYVEEDQIDDAVVVTKQLIRLQPLVPTAHGYMGDLMLKQEKDAEAIPHFERAFHLSPLYNFAAWQLVRLKIEAKSFEDAETDLEVYEYHNPNSSGAAEMRFRLHLAQLQKQKAIDAFKSLASILDVVEDTLTNAEDALREVHWGNEIAAAYFDVVKSNTTKSKNTVARWVANALYVSKKQVLKDIASLDLSPECHIAAWSELVLELSRSDRHIEAMSIVKKNRDVFRANDALWATGGYIFRMAGKQKQAVKWLSDWRDRENIEPQMMINVAISLLMTRGIVAAGPAHKYAADELPPTHETFLHHSCAALFEAAHGSVDEARRHIASSEFGVLNSFYQFVHRLAEYLINHHETGAADVAILRSAWEANDGFISQGESRKIYLTTVRLTFGSLCKAGPSGFSAIVKALRCILVTSL